MTRGLVLLGATGSIGDSTLDVVAQHPQRFRVVALAAHRNWRKVARLCARFRPDVAALLDPSAARELESALLAEGVPTRVLSGERGVVEAATSPDADTVLAAIVGAAGLEPTLAAARSGKRILLANKEALVIGGELFMHAALAARPCCRSTASTTRSFSACRRRTRAIPRPRACAASC
jgi:1-deoxy-D-xylulose-5-phosphate reductoisomerase